MNISVVLCTYNRCQSLETALESLSTMVMPKSAAWRVLIVDNNSKDRTREVAEKFCKRDPEHFSYIFERQQGKSFALNRGIREASGDVVVFVDDDITAEPAWLWELTKPLSEGSWAGTGGRVYLPKEFAPPSWIAASGPHSLLYILASFDLGNDAKALSIPPLGNNMAFRREVFEKYGVFRTDLGPRPGSEIRQEDTEFGWRVLNGGDQILYVPSAIVRHAVENNRMEKKYFLAYHFDHGRALVRERGDRGKVHGVPRAWISLVDRSLRMLPKKTWWWIRERDVQKRFFNKCHAWAMAGQAVELWHKVFTRSGKGVASLAEASQ